MWCPPPINGCNEVASSPYARIFNLPVGYFGVVYYLYMLCLAALLAYDPFSRGLRLAALIYSAIGVGFSIYFSYLQVTFIHAFCIYCLVSAISANPKAVQRRTNCRLEPDGYKATDHGRRLNLNNDCASVTAHLLNRSVFCVKATPVSLRETP